MNKAGIVHNDQRMELFVYFVYMHIHIICMFKENNLSLNYQTQI